MSNGSVYQELKPYTDQEFPGVLKKIIADEVFPELMAFVYPEIPVEDIRKKLLGFQTIQEFQHNFMAEAFGRIILKTSRGVTISGLENIHPDQSYLFIANHRDIILDSAVLQVLFVRNGLDTTEFAVGNNLMVSDFVADIGKINKMIIVIRDGSRRELLEYSKDLSAYIRESVTTGRDSVWIAQRNGRTKNGDDRTDSGLLKMLFISGPSDFVSNFSELNLIPVSISYEIEPCDILKTQEVYLRSIGPYDKKPGEDLNSILTGLRQQKGRIHLSIGNPLAYEDLQISPCSTLNDKIAWLGQEIDRQIHKNYHLWASNYIAFDILTGKSSHGKYSKEEMSAFEEYLHQKLALLDGDHEKLKRIFLGVYANPVNNALKVSGQIPERSDD
ncbi:MAG: 1-acyl-sn-glycerol-3-phosphate acyltransferase [Bacteroidetes bacterium]|nr:1-acyl-sn-glycerol-3-phosphate acyltransferase [Bacteroidota bacterium]